MLQPKEKLHHCYFGGRVVLFNTIHFKDSSGFQAENKI